MTKSQTRYIPSSLPIPDPTRRGVPTGQPKPHAAASFVAEGVRRITGEGSQPLGAAEGPDAAGEGAAPVWERIAACRICAPRFAATATRHAPRPVVWFRPGARLLIASQAPGARAHESGIPFSDASGERLREWMGVTAEEFYDRSRVAIVPMGFCFPGYDATGADIPPPAICAQVWRDEAMRALPGIGLTLVVGGAAQAWHLGRGAVTERVRSWRDHAPALFALPHPSWRNTAWLKRNPWFAQEVLPALRARVREVLNG